MKTNIKVIATSLSLATSVGAVAGIGGLSVQSHLGQPFSGSIVVSGDEARALIESGSVNVSGSGIRGSIVKQGEDRVVVRLRSSSPVREPVITFTVSAGRQTREYTAFLDPVRYTPKEAPIRQERHENDVERGEQEMRQGGKKQQKQHDFIERKKPTAEERRPASSVPAKADSEEMTEVKKTSKVAVSARRHRAHAGENVANIAERYRPRNMSQQAAVRALMLANPSAFKHGATIRRNVTLYIPTESQWHAYAQRAQKQVMKERVKQVRKPATAPQQPATVDMPAVDTAPVEPPKPVAPPKPVTPPKPAEPAKVEQPSASTPPQPNTPSKAVESAQPSAPQAKEVKSASVVESSSQPVKPAQPVSASPADTASDTASQATPPVAASGASVAASAAVQPRPPVQRPPVVEEPVEPVEEETDYLPLLAAGLGGAAVLGGVGYAIMRRRKNSATDSSDDSEWDTEETTEPSQSDEWGGDIDFGKAARPTTTPASNAFDDEYFGDDEFSLDKVSPAPAATSISKDEFSLDNFEPAGNSFDTFDDTQFTPSSNRQNDDWAWVEGEAPAAPTQSADDNFVVAEEDEWSMDKLDSISEVNKKTEQTFSLDDFVVDDIQPAASTAAVNVAKQNDSFDSFDLSDFDVAKQPESSVSSAKADDTFDLDSFDVPAAETKPAVQSADEDLSFGLDAFDDFVADKPAVETSAPAVQAAADDDLAFSLDDFVVAEPVAEKPAAPVVQAAADDDLAFSLDDFVVAEPVAEAPAAPVVEASADEDLSFGLDAFESFDAPVAPAVEKAAIDDVLADLPAFDDDAFTSTTVTTTTSSNTQISTDDDLSFGLDAFEDFDVPAEPAVEKAPVIDALADLPTFDDSEFVSTTAQTTTNTQIATDDDLSFGLDAFEDFTPAEPVIEKAPVVDALADLPTFDDGEFVVPTATNTITVQSVTDDDLSFGLDAFEDFTPVEPVVENKLEVQVADDLSFGLDAFEDFTPVEPVAESKPEVQVADDLSFGLDSFEDFTPVEPVAESKPEVQAAADDLSFGLDAFADFDAPAEPVAEKVVVDDVVDLSASFDNNTLAAVAPEVTAPAQPAIDDDLSFGLDAFDDFAPVDEANSVTSPSIEAAIADVADFDGFNLVNEAEVIATPNVTEPPISFDAPAVEDVITLDAPVITESLDDLSLDIDLMPTPPSAPVGMLDLATGPLASSSTLDAVNLDNLEVIDDLQGWEASSNENVGFVSGAVSDMTEPLEAKFELAKMYLEIDDAVAARETLRELISESTGNIQEQAKQLLADLGN